MINKVILLGNLGDAPEMRYTANGDAIANFSVATSERYKDKQTGESKTKTEWHRVVIFGKLASIAGEYLHKGSQVYLEGKIKTRKWQDNSGNDKYSTEIVLDGFSGQMKMLGGKQDVPASSRAAPSTQQQPPSQPNQFDDPFSDDIPFS